MESKSKNNVQTKLNETVDSVIQYREMNNNLNLKTKLFYSLGHIYNDLCASIWSVHLRNQLCFYSFFSNSKLSQFIGFRIRYSILSLVSMIQPLVYCYCWDRLLTLYPLHWLVSCRTKIFQYLEIMVDVKCGIWSVRLLLRVVFH